MTTIGGGKKTVTLAVTKPNVTLTGTIDAFGAAGSYAYTGGAAQDLDAAVFGPKAAHFTLTVKGDVLSKGSTAADFGIVLGAAGTLTNKGEIKGGGGVLVNGAASAAWGGPSGRFLKKAPQKLLTSPAFERPDFGRSNAGGIRSFLVTFFQKSNDFL